jgi:hypothetical protein
MQRYASLSRSSLLVVSVLAASFLFSGKTHGQLTDSDFSAGSSLLSSANPVGLIPPGTALPGWTATQSSLNGTTISDSNVYYFTTNPNAFFLPNPPPGFNFGVQLDSTTGTGSQEHFTPGAAIASDAFSLGAGTYQLSFDATTEVGSFNGVPKAGLGGVLVSLNNTATNTNILSGSPTPSEFLFLTSGSNTSASTAKWTPFTTTFSLVAPTTLRLTFADDPRMDLVGNLASSNTAVGGIVLVPEPTPLTLIGVGVVSLVGFQTLLKRRRA